MSTIDEQDYIFESVNVFGESKQPPPFGGTGKLQLRENFYQDSRTRGLNHGRDGKKYITFPEDFCVGSVSFCEKERFTIVSP